MGKNKKRNKQIKKSNPVADTPLETAPGIGLVEDGNLKSSERASLATPKDEISEITETEVKELEALSLEPSTAVGEAEAVDIPAETTPAPATTALRTVELGIDGMTCGMCTGSVSKALKAVEGVMQVSVSLATHSATIDYDESRVTVDALEECIEDIGYEVVPVDGKPAAKPDSSLPSSSGQRRNSACRCDVCFCGPNCQCTETLCRCEASSVLNSLSGAAVKPGTSCCGNGNPPTSAPSSCCGGKGNGVSVSVAGESCCSGSTGGAGIASIEIGVIGMTCTMCTRAVLQALDSSGSIVSSSVSLATNSATVKYNAEQLSLQQLKSLIEDVGYDVVLPEESDPSPNSEQTVEIGVDGMTCSMCVQAIQNALQDVAGVAEVSVTLATNSALVRFDPSLTSVEALKDSIEAVGYEVTHHSLQSSTSDEANPGRLDRLLDQQKRMVERRKRAFLFSLFGTCPILILTMILPHLPDNKLATFLHQKVQIGQTEFILEALILWLLCTPIQFGSGWSFYKTSYFNIQQGIMGMDVLVALGTTASYGYAVWATWTESMDYHFFETSAVLICFVLLGKWLQTLAVRRTSQALTQLLALQPKTAIRVLAPAGIELNNWDPLVDTYEEEIVPLRSVKKGDIVKVLKGSSIPADGLVRFGEMSVDESMITGESIPVLKSKGSLVLGGTICCEAGQEAGAGFVKVTGVGSETALSQIVNLVEDAQSRQVPIQNLADSIAGVFVPTVVTISVATFMIWYAAIQSHIVPASYLPEGESPATFSLLFGIACLVISCPCALGLATPTAVMVGTGVGAKNGILMKGGETLQLASSVDGVVFDKTGTLTNGKPVITDFSVMITDTALWEKVLFENKELKGQFTTEQLLLWLLGSLERNSEHPLASAVVTYAEEGLAGAKAFVQPSQFVALTGRGASGIIDGNIKVAVGNRAFCKLNNVDIDRQTEDAMQRLERQGKTAIVAAINDQACVVLGIADQLKEDAIAAINYLRDNMGVDVWMVTGDNRRTARAIAKKLQLPMDRVLAEALPVAKVEKVQELQAQGCTVAMVGDGVNDSPALAQADVGLSLGTGAEIATEAADMVLVKGNVSDVCTALDLSQVIFRRIKLNFLWSLLYNCLSIPIAAGLFFPLIHTRLPPTLAAIAMALSSISVVGSSLALRLYQAPAVVGRPSAVRRRQAPRSRPNSNPNPQRREISMGSEDLTEPLLSPFDRNEPTERTSNVSQDESEAPVIVAV